MNLRKIYDMAPWDWPEDTGRVFKHILDDRSADQSDRLLAVEMAGNFVVINDELAKTLLAVACNNDETEKLRVRAVISLGPALEHADIYEFDDPEDIVLSEEAFREIQVSLKKIYHDAGIPKEVRRRTLEAAVRAPQEWHLNALRAAYASDDEDWHLTAVFCMRFIKGFEPQILESLESVNPDIRYQAVCGAGNWGIKKAWPHVAGLLDSGNDDRSLLLAAIDAAASIDLPEAKEYLGRLLDSDDDDIIDAVSEALTIMGVSLFGDEYEKDNDW
ncbi:MAG: HEAT repeat domain-containing protein [Desulfosarcina sp.]|nr:HEAT repeat domain-containing protein [Desulfosarcina sp.]MBC2744457.1 HEAT repeat domain-containing protein [Desulfosarcina sp.]MBC2767365.1 hypothetical protein [Desulfosarcina sp.]